ncbi:MAG TPA: 2-oxoacid:acceptor oxidoreductase subunit alpha [Spirochaetia bacterium]|nr:2-oxoacid:acceptor oxidoreductase subunit alpha [Spirochaetia bacterium]
MNENARLMQGNEAVVEAACAAGLKFFAGYPITPATDIAEMAAVLMPKAGGVFVQMEDEIASMAAVIGASLTGAKAMTATSGPGFSLMQENIGFAAMAEVPCVIVDVQRLGPSTGIATAPAQGDVMQVRWGTHGDHPVVALAPAGVAETYDLTVKAFNLAESLRTPVVLLLDEVVAHMREGVVVPDAGALVVRERRRPPGGPAYRALGDGVPAVPDFGSGGAVHVTGLVHDERGLPSNDRQVADALIRRLHDKVQRAAGEFTFTNSWFLEDADVAVVAYGSVVRAAHRAVVLAREKGLRAGLLQLQTIWPFPAAAVASLGRRVSRVIVPEMNLGQLVGEVERVVRGQTDVIPLSGLAGRLFTPDEILNEIIRRGKSARAVPGSGLRAYRGR